MSNGNGSCCSCARVCAYIVGIVGTFVVMAGMVRFVRQHNPPVLPDHARAEARSKALKELVAANMDFLNSYGWVDETRGITHIPVTEALKIAEQEWKDPVAARKKLSGLADKATAAVKAAPSQFE
ncbi:MAG TPA: hypothetical protein VHH73_15565 [Verrucomicrobiae bacterium]|nr:hypothetical protein [Verrucomicrobiae bacterium]